MAFKTAWSDAYGILAKAYALSEKDAVAWMMRESRESGRPVYRIAEKIISSHRVVDEHTPRR
jgi:AmiR/NasT family two-component response regulator